MSVPRRRNPNQLVAPRTDDSEGSLHRERRRSSAWAGITRVYGFALKRKKAVPILATEDRVHLVRCVPHHRWQHMPIRIHRNGNRAVP